MNNILVVAAHPDDEVLGCGGTLLKHAKQGDELSVIALTDGETARTKLTKVKERRDQIEKVTKKLRCKYLKLFSFPDNALDSVPLLDIARVIEAQIKIVKPNVIYTHFLGDLNIDHGITTRAVLTAARPGSASFVPEINSFEILSSTQWFPGNPNSDFSPNFYVRIDSFLEEKIELMKIYQDEIKMFPHPRSVEGIKILAGFRGMQVGLKTAEAFIQLRKVVKEV